MAKLIVNPTSPWRREVLLTRPRVSIGRDPGNDLVLPDAMVSRRHAVIEHRGAEYFLKDCNSSNGSLVNGDRVDEKSLRDGDVVALGAVRLIFREDLRLGAGTKIVQHPSAPRLECPSCRAPHIPGDLFCRQCGAGLLSGPPRTACASCGSAVRLPARFCNVCGSSLDGGEERSAALDPPPRRQGQGSQHPADAARADQSHLEERAFFLRRAAAGLVDAVFVLLGQALIVTPAILYWSFRDGASEVRFVPVLLTLCLVPLALFLGSLYYVFCWGVRGATPGEFLLGLVVQSEDGEEPIGLARAVMRFVGYLASAASVGIGFLLIAFEGRGLHDYIAGTRVVRRGRA